MDHTQTTIPSFDTLIGGMSGYERFSLSKEIKHVNGVLKEGEKIQKTAKVFFKGKYGLLVVTSEAVHFIRCGIFWGSATETFTYQNIVSLSSAVGVLTGDVYFTLKSGEKISFLNVKKNLVSDLKNYINTRLS